VLQYKAEKADDFDQDSNEVDNENTPNKQEKSPLEQFYSQQTENDQQISHTVAVFFQNVCIQTLNYFQDFNIFHNLKCI